jgi:hypothetical protein
MRQLAFLPILALALSGCAVFQKDGAAKAPTSITGPVEPQPATEFAPAVSTSVLGARAVSAAALDRTTEAEKAAALDAPASGGERELGKVVVALGPPAEQGIWLSSALVKAKAQGRIVTAAGKSLTLELRPGTGGALLSLAAFQALGMSLTELPEVTVYGR